MRTDFRHPKIKTYVLEKRGELLVLVQREMESGRAPLASITPIPRGQFAPPEAWRPGGRVPSGRNRNWFHKKGNQLGGSHSPQVALRSGKQLARKRVSNTRTAKLLNKQPCRCHHAGAFVLRETATEAAPCFQFPDRASSSSDPDGHIDDLAAQVGNVLADVFGTELVWRTGNIAPTTRRCCQSKAPVA